MELKLAENIRRSRKERLLTQEQLAEVLGVTAGAVYKWEAGLSVPDLGLIMEMADFFDVSVDVLLGYEMKDNRLEATVQRLRELRRRKDRGGLSEAEMALKKYPHSFRIVNESATLYRAFGIEDRDASLFRRALDLLEQARLLLPQNEDPEIGEQTLYGKMAEIHLGLGSTDKAVELWKTHNDGAVFSHKIGHVLSQGDRAGEAGPYLSEALAKILGDLAATITGYLNFYVSFGDYDSAEAILRWGTGLYAGLRKGDTPNFFDKLGSAMLAALASVQRKAGRKDEARASLEQARDLAAFFDTSPSYDEADIRFIGRIEGASVHDDIGSTAADAVDRIVREAEDDTLTALWNEIREEKTDGKE